MTWGLDPFIRELVEEGWQRDVERRRRAFYVRLRRIVSGTTIMLGATFLYVGFRARDGSFLQSLMANLSTGAGLFLAIPLAFKKIQAKGFGYEAIAAVLAAASLTGAYFAGTMLQSVLINVGGRRFSSDQPRVRT
jgi:hypothetical protein